MNGYKFKEPLEYPGNKSRVCVFLLLFLSLHGVGFAGACLSVGKYGRVIAFQGFLNEVVNVGLLVKLLLGDWLVEHIIKIKVFMVVAVINFDFFAWLAYFDVWVNISILNLRF